MHCIVSTKLSFTLSVPRQVARLDRDVGWARALDGTEYMPGLVGLNNMKANDYANVVIQVRHRLLSRQRPWLLHCDASWRTALQECGEDVLAQTARGRLKYAPL